MNKPPMHEVFNTIVNLLTNAVSNDLMCDLKDRYNTNWPEKERIEERHGYHKAAEKSWAAAKHLYCLYQDDLDPFYEAHKSMLDRKNNDHYEAMRLVIKDEMTKELETILGDVSDSISEHEKNEEDSKTTASSSST